MTYDIDEEIKSEVINLCNRNSIELIIKTQYD
jgi:hypothetical protein